MYFKVRYLFLSLSFGYPVLMYICVYHCYQRSQFWIKVKIELRSLVVGSKKYIVLLVVSMWL